MNKNEMALSYPWQDALPAPGQAMTVADGVKWVRLPLPFALDHVNVWLLRDEVDGRQGWMVVDCGIARDEVREQWESIFTQALEGLPVLRVLVTHMHPDHVGLADWLCQRWQAPLLMSMSEYTQAVISSARRDASAGAGGLAAAAHFRRHGLLDDASLALLRERSGYYANMVPSVPSTMQRLLGGDRLRIGGRDWLQIVGYGHAPEHIGLYCEALQLLISGDMVLPRISTNVGVFEVEPEGDPLRLYLQSLDAYRDMPADTLVLPSHGRPFRGLHARIGQQREHHEARLQEVVQACTDQPCSAADIVPIMFRRKLDLHQLTFAMGEALAHLHLLWHAGRLTRRWDDDGVYRFIPVAASGL